MCNFKHPCRNIFGASTFILIAMVVADFGVHDTNFVYFYLFANLLLEEGFLSVNSEIQNTEKNLCNDLKKVIKISWKRMVLLWNKLFQTHGYFGAKV